MYKNTQVIEAIQKYDRKLYVKWSNLNSVWEVWRRMPWSHMLVTPITCNIYEEGADQAFAPLDHRILEWLYSADSQRKDRPLSWKFNRNRNIRKIHECKQKKFATQLKNQAKDIYYMVNNELISGFADQSGWKRPEVQGASTKRVMYRKKYYNYDGN